MKTQGTSRSSDAKKSPNASVAGADAVTEYIASFKGETKRRLEEMRAIIASVAKGAEERISYGMPSFHQGGPIVYYAGYKAHIGLYPLPSGIEAFRADLAKFKHSKGAVQFPLDEELPVALIKRIVKFRLSQ